jgi:Zn-dependent peptidase ImmA (M78 family)
LFNLPPNPEVYARSLLSRLKLRRIGDINSFAALLGLKIKEVDSDGFEGALVRVPQQLKGIVAIKRDIREDGRKRFTFCHEVGHFVLPGHGTADCICLSEEVESWRNNMPEQELAANQFAAELLLPYREVEPLVRKADLTIKLAKNVSSEFQASLTAATLKCVDVTTERCAVAFSVAGSIKWFRRNENFHYFIRVNQKVGDESYAAQLFSKTRIDEPFGAVPADAWLQAENLPSDARIWEDSIYLPTYNSTITILTIHKELG